MDDCFRLVAENQNIDPQLREISKNLAGSFDMKDPASLEDAVQLATLLHVLRFDELSTGIVEKVGSADFDGNFDRWTWIELALVLGIRLKRLLGDVSSAENLKVKVLAVLDCGDETQVKLKHKVFNRFMRGSLLSRDKAVKAQEDGYFDSEVLRRLSYFRELAKISELGGSSEYPVERAEREISENIDRLNEIIKKDIKYSGIFDQA